MKKILILFLLLTVSCKTQQKTIAKTSTNVVVKSEVIKVSEPQLTELVVDEPCDENGNLRPINYVLNTPNSKTVISSEGNKLNVFHKKDSVVAKDTSEKQVAETIEKENTVIIKYKNKKLMWYSIFLNIALLGYIFRKPILAVIKKIVIPI